MGTVAEDQILLEKVAVLISPPFSEHEPFNE